MTYTGAMVLPQNAVVLQEEEMRYVEGGATTSTWVAKASLVKRRLRSFVFCGKSGTALSGALATLLGSLVKLSIKKQIMAAFALGSWFDSWRDNANKALGAASKYSDNTLLALVTRTGSKFRCTGMMVNRAYNA